MNLRFSPAVIGTCLLLAGCTGLTPSAQTQHRIEERREVFNALKPRQQEDILGGAIERNYTTDQVYLALGKPAKIVTSADGEKAMWLYHEYYVKKAAFTTSYNNPNSSTYTPGATGVNSGGNHGGPAWANEPSFVAGATQASGPSQSLTLPDVEEKTVYVFFFRSRVCEIKVAGDVSDQVGAAANIARKPKSRVEDTFTRSIYGGSDPMPESK